MFEAAAAVLAYVEKCRIARDHDRLPESQASQPPSDTKVATNDQ